jgi:MarR family 2-MHQ and catechol resistance regulon transcriptional repressor
VDNLEGEGLVQRDRDTTDRRVIYVSLTPAGESKFDSLYPDHLERIREVMQALTIDECRQLTMLLQKVSPEYVEISCAPSDPIAAR